MNNRLETLKIFCVAAETLQFKETANRLALTPPVVSRVIAELEDFLGEPLFVRNTRQVRLSAFGEAFLPQAQQLLADSEKLFVPSRLRQQQEMRGVVRLTLPASLPESQFLPALLQRLKAYPELRLEWHQSSERLNVVNAQIDIGLRIGFPATDSNLIVKKLGTLTEKIVASPDLLARVGTPQSLEDLQKLPLIAMFDPNKGRVWNWYFNEAQQLIPNHIVFTANNPQTALLAVRSGIGVAHLMDCLCAEDLAKGNLQELLSDIPKQQWPLYLYRPQQIVTPPRVKLVFDWLAEILTAQLQSK